MKLLSDIMSHLATNMPHIAPFEGSKGHGAPSDVVMPESRGGGCFIVVEFDKAVLEEVVC